MLCNYVIIGHPVRIAFWKRHLVMLVIISAPIEIQSFRLLKYWKYRDSMAVYINRLHHTQRSYHINTDSDLLIEHPTPLLLSVYHNEMGIAA